MRLRFDAAIAGMIASGMVLAVRQSERGDAIAYLETKVKAAKDHAITVKGEFADGAAGEHRALQMLLDEFRNGFHEGEALRQAARNGGAAAKVKRG